MLRFGLALFGRSTVLCALLIGAGCSEPPAPQSNAVDAKQQKQLQDLADEVKRLRQEVAEKEVADKKAVDAGVREAEQLAAARRALPIVSSPTDEELERARVLSSIEELTFDDRKVATEIYEKIEADVLSLTVHEAAFASSGNGSSALAQPFAERLLAIVKQGVPQEFWIGWPRFGYPTEKDNWHVPVLLSAAKSLKLQDVFEMMSLCRRCFSENGRGLSRLDQNVEVLTRKDPNRRNNVMNYELDDLKREPLLKHILDDYLRWAVPSQDSRDAAKITTEKNERKAADDLKQKQSQEEIEIAAKEDVRTRKETAEAEEKKRDDRRLATEQRIADFRERRGEFVPSIRTEKEKDDLAKTWARLQAQMGSNAVVKPAYSAVSNDVKTLVSGGRSAKDRSTALSELCRYFRRVVVIVHGLDGRVADADAIKNRADALKDFDEGIQIVFPGLKSSEMIQPFFQDSVKNGLDKELDLPLAHVLQAIELREKLTPAGQQKNR